MVQKITGGKREFKVLMNPNSSGVITIFPAVTGRIAGTASNMHLWFGIL